MTLPELTWLPIEPSGQELEFMAFLEENRRRIINALALSPTEIGEVPQEEREDDEALNLNDEDGDEKNSKASGNAENAR